MVVAISQNDLLKAAVVKPDVGAVREYLSRGALPSSRDAQAATPLHWAAADDSAEVAAVLLQAGAEVDARACDNSTPLHWACREDAVSVVKLLLAAGADPEARTSSGSTPRGLIYDDVDGGPGEQLAALLPGPQEGAVKGEVTRLGVVIDRSEQQPMKGQVGFGGIEADMAELREQLRASKQAATTGCGD